VTGFLIVYSLPIVALMSLSRRRWRRWAGAAGRVGGYASWRRAGLVPLKGAAATIVSFLVPGRLKPYLLQPELGPALAACAGALATSRCTSFLGWQVFRTGRVMADAPIIRTGARAATSATRARSTAST
jgi:hypothetical protein